MKDEDLNSDAGLQSFLFIPTYNVADRVISVLERIPPSTLAKFRQVLLIDNGSTDGTREALRAWIRARGPGSPFRLFFNRRNYSLGGSTIIAFREALARGGNFLVCLHGDGQADPAALERFLELASPGVDFVLGNRLKDRANAKEYSLLRWWGNKVFAWAQDLIARQHLGDIGAYIGFNLRTVAALPYASLPPDMGYQPLLILAAARAKKIQVVEFPISWGKADRTNINPFQYGLTHALRLLQLAVGLTPRASIEQDFQTDEVF